MANAPRRLTLHPAIFFFVGAAISGCGGDVAPREPPVGFAPEDSRGGYGQPAQPAPPPAATLPAPTSTSPPPVDGAETARPMPQALSPEEKAAHIEDATRELEDAERSLRRAFLKPADAPKNKPGPPAPEVERTAPDCQTACAAYRSMARSASYLCRLAGESDARCASAKDRVANAERRIQRARCACPEATSAVCTARDPRG